MRVLAVDPGRTSGVAGYDTEAATCFTAETSDLKMLVETIDRYRPDVVVVEDFRLYPWRAAALSNQRLFAAEVIGAVCAWCDDSCTHVYRQSASARKAVPAQWLDALGFTRLTRGMPHARDAARHLVHYIAKRHRDKLKVGKEESGESDKDCAES